MSEAEKKERKRIANKQYYLDNKVKIAEQQKKYNEANREKIAEYNEQYYLDNKKKIKDKILQYYLDNKEKLKDKILQYQKENPKTNRISNWKYQGIIDDDYDLLWDIFIKETNCWICGKEFNKDNGMDKRCLDHDHDITDDGNVRYILCGYCNLHVVVR